MARVELRRSIRATTDNVVQTAALALAGLVLVLPVGAAGTYLAYQFGRELRDGAGQIGPLPVVEFFPGGLAVVRDVAPGALGAPRVAGLFRGGLAVVLLVVVAMAAFRAAAGRTELDEAPFLLTGAPVPTVVTGQLLAEWLRLATWVGVPLLAITGAVGVGAGSPLPTITVAAAVLAIVGAGYPVGFAIGFAIRHLATVFEPIARHRLAFAALALLAYMGLILSDLLAGVVEFAFRTLQDSPLGWLGDVALVGLPGSHGSPVFAAAGLGVAAALFGAGAVATTAIARRNWFADPALLATDVDRYEYEGAGRLESLFASVARQSTATVATTIVRRARRKPLKLVFAAYPLFFAVGFVQQAIQQGRVPQGFVPWAALYGVWAGGALVTLNPIGDLGDAAPSTVLSGMDGASFVRGHLLVALPVTAVLAVGLTGAAAVLSGLEAGRALALLAVAAVGAVWSPLVALGVGASAPRFGSVAVFRNATATLPSKRAFVTHGAALLGVALGLAILDTPGIADILAAVLSLVAGFVLRTSVSIDPTWVSRAAWVVVGLGVVAPFAAYYYAVRAFDRFRLS